METLILHRTSKDNVGDYYSNPSLYFEFPNVTVNDITKKNNVENKFTIVGGGGLIHPRFSLFLKKVSKKSNMSVLWGVGHNYNPKMKKGNDIPLYPKWIKNFNLVGIRDHINLDLYLPCASCMHPAFDKTYDVTNDVVYFLHAHKSKGIVVDHVPVMYNDQMDIYKVIEFLGSAKTVVTNSYHGAYWSMLLGKSVNTTSWSTKFEHFKYPPHFLKKITDTPNDQCTVSKNYLSECRNLNKEFYKKVLLLIEQGSIK